MSKTVNAWKFCLIIHFWKLAADHFPSHHYLCIGFLWYCQTERKKHYFSKLNRKREDNWLMSHSHFLLDLSHFPHSEVVLPTAQKTTLGQNHIFFVASMLFPLSDLKACERTLKLKETTSKIGKWDHTRGSFEWDSIKLKHSALLTLKMPEGTEPTCVLKSPKNLLLSKVWIRAFTYGEKWQWRGLPPSTKIYFICLSSNPPILNQQSNAPLRDF